jgi:hypothetical protein
MANPSYSNIHPVNEILRNLAIEAIPSDGQLIADQVIEAVDIKAIGPTGTLLIEETRNFMGSPDVDAQRAPGADRQRIGNFDRSSTTFSAKIYSLSDEIALEDIKYSQYPGNEEQRSFRKVQRSMLLNREARLANLLFGASNWGSYTSALASLGSGSNGTQWNQAGAEPLTDLHALLDVIRANSHGINPDTLVLGYGALRALARNAEVRGFFTAGSTPSGTAAGNRLMKDDMVISVLKDVLGIPNVHVGQARKETANAGLSSAEAQVWTDDSVFMGIMKGSDAIANKQGVKVMPVAALNFVYEGYSSGAYDDLAMTKRTVWMEHTHQDKVIAQNYGFLLTDCLA